MSDLTDNCSGCKQDYDLTSSNTVVCVFVLRADVRHLKATCPFCQSPNYLFCDEATALEAVQMGCKLAMGPAPHPDLIRMYDELNMAERIQEKQAKQATPAEVPVPREWLRQLYDDLRAFGGE